MQQLYSSWVRTPAVAESTMVMMWGVFWSAVAVYVILPYFNSGGNFDYADKVNFSAALGDPFGSAQQMLSNNTKLATLGLLLITGAILWVISPLAAIALPTLAWRLLSTMESYWASTWHYSLVLMPVVFLALLDAVMRIRYGVVPAAGRERGVDPATGHTIIVKDGRYGPYVTEVLPEPTEGAEEGAKKTKKAAAKPRTASLFKTMDIATVTLEDALNLLSLPREVGTDPASGEVITAQNGRYGPYLKKGTDSRTLASEDQLLTITLDEALAIYAQPKTRGRGTARPPLREFGEDPISGKKVTVKDGRFGPYVTDGETNVTVPRAETVEDLTAERAYELLADKRAKGPAPKRTRKTAAKKTTTKKTTAAKKTTTKKTTAAKKTTTAKKTATKKAATKKDS